jgi:hypothetical protein
MNTNAILKAVLFTPGPKGRWGLPAIFEGEPGGGKTSVIENFGERHGLHTETIIGSIREPTDVGGLARLFDDCFRLMPAGWAIDMVNKHPHGIVFLDELNTNVPAMQAALLRLATDGAVGELKLPPTVRVLAAMNKTADSANGWDLAPPLANRFGHFAWESPSWQSWSAWLLGAEGQEVEVESAAAIEARVLKAFPEPFAKAKGLVTGFLKAQPSLLHRMPKSGSPDQSRAWPSPRTWELATRALAGAEVLKLTQTDSEELITAYVGVGPAAELIQYQTKADLPDPSDVLDEKVTFKHDPKRLDRTTAVLSACAAIIAPDKAPRRKERAEVLWRYIEEVAKDAADVTVQAAGVLSTKGFITGKSAYAALAKLQPILAAAGYTARRE